jgi:hypothetical protein
MPMLMRIPGIEGLSIAAVQRFGKVYPIRLFQLDQCTHRSGLRTVARAGQFIPKKLGPPTSKLVPPRNRSPSMINV